MSDDSIRDALKMMPYGFYAFTTKNGDDVNAMVVNWVSQMSYAPRLIARRHPEDLLLARRCGSRPRLRLEPFLAS